MDIVIHDMKSIELDVVLTLVLDVFLEFEAPEYSAEGVQEFREFITKENIASMIHNNQLSILVAVCDQKIVGMIAVKNYRHISLLFVDKKYHRMGIARKLFGEMLKRSNSKNIKEMTVNSSPYAVPIYKRLGFDVIASEQCVNGIRFTQMKYSDFKTPAVYYASG